MGCVGYSSSTLLHVEELINGFKSISDLDELKQGLFKIRPTTSGFPKGINPFFGIMIAVGNPNSCFVQVIFPHNRNIDVLIRVTYDGRKEYWRKIKADPISI